MYTYYKIYKSLTDKSVNCLDIINFLSKFQSHYILIYSTCVYIMNIKFSFVYIFLI